MTIDFHDVLTSFQGHGVRFEYPDIWQIAVEETEGDVIVTITATETCFWLLRILRSCPTPPEVIESCLTGFREEYDEVEETVPDTSLCDLPAAAADVSFVCMDLLNSAALRSVRTLNHTLLVWWQSSESELEEAHAIFDHMSASLSLDRAAAS
ncbi:MAG: hypothetical protein NXI04_10855 [Planctomycetaceae bacterium]|nr:hypothetical protein [Planctomycetaceae bacterium]